MNAKPAANAKPPAGLMHCSFCGKSQLDVKKLIAGPGVLICDECVTLCITIIADSPDPDPAEIKTMATMPSEQLLKILAGLETAHARVSQSMQDTVDILRQREVSWADIGGALNVSRQAAWERFS